MSNEYHIPPQDKELEAAVLGAMLLERKCVVETIGTIQTEDVFYDYKHREIYRAILEMYDRGQDIDLLTVSDYLKKHGKLDSIGGIAFISELVMNITSSAHIAAHAKIIVEKYLSRQLIEISNDCIKNAYDGADPFDLMDRIVRDFNKSFDLKNSTAWVNMQEAGKRFLTQREIELSGDKKIGVSTTITKLDKENGFIKPGQLAILAALTSVGKSALASDIALNTAKHIGPVGIINAEMLVEEQFSRMISQSEGMNSKRVDTDPSLSQIIANATDKLSRLPIFFFNKTDIGIRELVSGAEYLKSKHDIKLLIIDYVQLINAPKMASREREVAYISRQLKTLALGLKIPILALSQLNADSEKRADKKPAASDLRESKALSQDADIIMLLHRDFRAGIITDSTGRSTFKDVDIIVPKWRNGSPCEIKYGFNPEFMKFYDPDAPIDMFASPPIESQTNHHATMRQAWQNQSKPYTEDDKPF